MKDRAPARGRHRALRVGQEHAIHVLEDLGFYCIDNLPVALIPRFIELWESSQRGDPRASRSASTSASGASSTTFPRVLEELRAAGVASR